jgi:predicted lipid-binding transport protein (Tim44 family)
MHHFIGILLLLLSLALMVGWASDFQSTDSGSSAAYDSSPDTSIQNSIDRMNQQMAADAANAAAQQQFLAGMATAQETMNNANNNQATSNW